MNNRIQILKTLCDIRDKPSHLIYGVPVYTNRLKYILNTLVDFEVPFEVDRFDNKMCQSFHNVYCYVNGLDKSKDSLILTAHHDVLKTQYENCNDNSASIFILLMLAKYFNNIDDLGFNLIVAFTDSEERGFWGIDRLGYQFEEGVFEKSNIIHIINLELCAYGDSVWVEDHEDNSLILEHAKKYFKGEVEPLLTPASDSTFLRSPYGSSRINNITTIGLLNKNKDGSYNTSPWNDVHTKRDTFDKADVGQMQNLLSFLEKVVLETNNSYNDK